MSKSNVLLWSILMFVLSTGNMYGQFAGGSGTESEPYQVASAEQLNSVRNYTSAWFIQTADINLGVSPWDQGEGWVPIGSSASIFTCQYNGNNFHIIGLYINRPLSDYQGLFGYTSAATLNNITISDATVAGHNYVGGLVGALYNSSSINYCFVNGSIIGNDTCGGLTGCLILGSFVLHSRFMGLVNGNDYVGGIVGSSYSNSTAWNYIDKSYSSGEVIGNNNVGGLYGHMGLRSNIHRSLSICNVNGYNFVGGLAGSYYHANILNSYYIGNVTGNSIVGGIYGGPVAGAFSGQISNCFSRGFVTGSSESGGIAGRAGSFYSIRNYWDIDVSGQTWSALGEGRTTDDMTYPYATNTYIDWDFSDIWSADPEYVYNDGYPYLQEQFFVSNISSIISVDFHPVFVEEQSDYQVIPISNNGTMNILISDVHFMSTPTNFEFINPFREFVIAPGETDSIMVRFTPHAVGALTDTLFIVNSSANSPILRIRLRGTGLHVLPRPPQNLNLTMNGNDAYIQWDPVTQNMHDQMLVPDYYFVYIASDPYGDYTLMTLTPNINYTHPLIGFGAERMFYRVTAVKFYRDDLSPSLLDDYLKTNIAQGMAEAEVQAILRLVDQP